MKVLIVSFAFPPSNSIGAVRVGKFAKHFLDRDHDVRVLTVREDGLPQTLECDISEDRITRTAWLNVNRFPLSIIRWRGDLYRRGYERSNPSINWMGNLYKTFFNFPDGQIGWLPFAVAAGKRLLKTWRADVIYASAMPFTSLIVGSVLSKHAGIPWIAEYRDLWVDSHYYDHPDWRKKLENAIETRFVQSADGLVTVSDPLAKVLQARFDKPTATILNGFVPEDFVRVRDKHRRDVAGLNIVYTGIVYPGRRDPSPLFEAIAGLGKRGKRITVTYYGRILPSIESLARKYGIESQVHVHPDVSHLESLRHQVQADVLLLLLWNDPRERGVFTGKIFEYLGARRPILLVGCDDGVAASLIRERKVGFASSRSQEIQDKLGEWLEDKDKNHSIADLSSQAVYDFTRQHQFLALERFVTRTLAGFPSRVDERGSQVVVVIRKLDIGGTEHHLLRVLPRISKAGIPVSVYVLRSGGTLEADLKRAGVSVHGPSITSRRLFGVLAGAVGLAGFLFRERPRIVHFFLLEAYIVGGLISRISPPAELVMSRRSLNSYQKRFPMLSYPERWLHSKMDVILGNSRAVVNELREEGVCESRLGHIYNGLDTDRYDKMPGRAVLRESLGIQNDILVLILVANLIPYKGHADLLAALGIIREQLPAGWIALMVGRDDGIGNDLATLASTNAVDQHVQWMGEVLNVPELLGAADIAVLPSHEEGFSNSVLESMAAGVPIIATDVGGNPEVVIHEKNGLVVPAHSPQRLSEAIMRLAGDPAERLRLGTAGRHRIRSQFSLSSTIEQYCRLYQSLLNPSTTPVDGSLHPHGG